MTQKKGNFWKTQKNWRNPTKKNFIDRNWTITTCLLREVVCSSRSLFRSAANCTWLPLRISEVPVFFLCHLVLRWSKEFTLCNTWWLQWLTVCFYCCMRRTVRCYGACRRCVSTLRTSVFWLLPLLFLRDGFLPVVHQLVGILPLVGGQIALLCVRSLLLTSVPLKYVPQFKPSVVSLMMALWGRNMSLVNWPIITSCN